MITADPRSILSVGATLGEGPVWVARDAALWFVDIKAHRVHRYDPALDVGRLITGQGGAVVTQHLDRPALGLLQADDGVQQHRPAAVEPIR